MHSDVLSGSAAWSLLDSDLTQQTGHKLRLSIPETAVIRDDVLTIWLRTNSKTGVLQSVPRCQHSTTALLQSLKSQHAPFNPANPDGWVAVAHFSEGLSWLVDAAGLEQLLSKVYVGAVPEEVANSSSTAGCEAAWGAPALQMLQAYIVPSQDERFVTTFGGVEGPATTTHVRSYSQRYRGPASAASAQGTVMSALQQAQAHAQAAAASAAVAAGGVTGHSRARQHGSCTGSIASLSAGLAVGEPRAWSEAAGSTAGQAEEFVGPSGAYQDGDGSRDSRSSSGRCRGSCSSQGLSVDVDAAGCSSGLQLGCGTGAAARHYQGHDSVCETPTLGLATAAAIDRHQAAGLFRMSGHAHAAEAAANSTTILLTSNACDAAGESLSSCSDLGQQLYSGGAACSSAGLVAGSAQAAGLAVGGPWLCSTSTADGGSAGCEAVRPAPGRIAKAAAAAVQALTSYLDKGLGLRVQGLVAEFIQVPATAANPEQQPLVLVGLPHLSLDRQQSRGGATTFTERWGDFLAGTGPPPAPSPADHTTYGRAGPSAQSLRTSAQEASCPAAHASCSPPCTHAQQPCAVFSPLLHPFLQQQHGTGADSCMRGRQARQGGFGSSSSAGATGVTCLAQQLNRQFFPALLGGQHGAAGSQQHWVRPPSPDLTSVGKAPSRPLSAPRSTPRPASPHHTLTRPATASPGRMRTGCSSSGGGCSTIFARQTAAAAGLRAGGGNPVPRSSAAAAGSDSCRLWLQGAKPGDSLTAQLAAQLEAAREQVQQYAEAADAAALTAHYAVTQAAQQVGQVQQELLQLRDDAAAAGHERRQLQQQISSLQQQRSEQGSMMQALQQQLAQLQEQLGQDRGTLSTMLRQHQEREQQLQEELAASQQQAAELRASSAQLSSRLDEESEVVQALRAQLVEYRLQMGQMQLQAKKGRTLNPNQSLMLRRPGSATPTGQLGLGSTAGGGGLGGLWSMQSGPLAAAGLGGGVNDLLGGSHAGGGMTRSGSLLAAQLQGLAAAEGALGQSGRLEQQRLQHTRTASSEWQPNAAGKGHYSNPDRPGKAGPAPPSKAGISTQWAAAGGSAQQEMLSCSSHSSSNRSTVELSSTAPAASGMLPVGCQWQGGTSGAPGASSGAAARQHQQLVGSNCEGIKSSSNRATDPQPQAVSTAQQQAAAVSTAAPASSDAAPSSPNSKTTSSGSEPSTTAGGSISSNSKSERPGGPTTGGRKSPEASKQGAAGPEAVVAEMVSSISADLGGSLAAAAPVDPPLLIGFLDPSAPAQLALIGGLMREVYGDLLEVYTYHAILGKAQVVADRLTLELPQFGRLAYDLHLAQDNVTLSAIEDVFYLLSDRKPCQVLAAEAAQAHAASGTRATGSSGHTARGTGQGGSGTARAAEARGVQMPKDLMVPEQFPEALVRLACVRYRYGVVNWEYNWDESTDDESYYTDSLSGTGDGGIMSPRTARLRQQQQDAQVKQGPKVLKPEGASLRSTSPGPAADRSGQRQSFSRPVPEPYKLPVESDDLATVVRTFLQFEVMKYGRRSKLAGSSLGIRRARDKPPPFQSWQAFPAGSAL